MPSKPGPGRGWYPNSCKTKTEPQSEDLDKKELVLIIQVWCFPENNIKWILVQVTAVAAKESLLRFACQRF
jgi:hypothetical protein